MAQTIEAQIQVRRDTAAALAGIVPADGEIIYEKDTKLQKIGDGVSSPPSLDASAFVDANTHLFGPAVLAALDARYPASTLTPAMVAAAVPGGFDAARTLYNRSGSNTQRTAFSLAKAAAGLGLSVIALTGDSTTTQYATGAYSRDLLAEALERAGVPIAGEIVMANKGGPDVRVDERITLTGTWAKLGDSNFLESDASGNRIAFTSKRPGSIVQFKYMSNTPAHWRLDGGEWADLAQVGTSPTTAQLTGQGDTVHTIEIETTGSGSFWIGSLGVFRPTGVIVLNTAAESTGASSWVVNNPWSYAPFTKSFSPDAVFVNLGINDQHSSDDATAFATALGSVLNQFSSASDVYIETSNPTGWSEYLGFDAVKYKLAYQRNMPLVDVHQRFGSYAAANSAGMYVSGDNTHPNLAGYFLKAQARLAALLPR